VTLKKKKLLQNTKSLPQMMTTSLQSIFKHDKFFFFVSLEKRVLCIKERNCLFVAFVQNFALKKKAAQITFWFLIRTIVLKIVVYITTVVVPGPV
jgi:hypothetical protein